MFIWVVISLHFYLVTVLAGSYNFVFIQQTFWYFFECIFGSILLYKYLENRYDYKRVMYLLLTVFVIQSVFVILTFVSDSLRDAINSALVINDDRDLSTYRMKGLTNSGGAGLSYIQTIGVLFGCVLWVQETKRANRFYLAIAMGVILTSQMFIARTGLIFTSLLIFMAYTQQAINKGSIFILLKQLGWVVGLGLFFFQVLVMIIPEGRLASFQERVVGRSFEFIESYERTGEFRTTSTDVLKKMYILPDDDIELLFGIGEWDAAPGTRGYFQRRVPSDVGYVRAIYAVGLIMSIIFYSIYFNYIKVLLKSEYARQFLFLFLTLSIIFILGETKEPFLVRATGVIKALFLFHFSFIWGLSKTKIIAERGNLNHVE
jgi:hypothetical protein